MLSRTTASNLSYVTATILTYTPAPDGEVVSLYSRSPVVTLPATLSAVGSGVPDCSFVPSLVTSDTPVTITASYNGTSAATLTVTPPTSGCSNLAGLWNTQEQGSVTFSLNAAGQTEKDVAPIDGGGNLNIAQTGSAFSYSPVADGVLVSTGLTDQLTRNGSVSGTAVSVSGPLAVLQTVEAAEISANPGLTVSSVSVGANSMNGNGQVQGNVMTINETGQFTASGKFSYEGTSGSFSLNITSSSTAVFNWSGGGQRQDARGPGPEQTLEVHVTPENPKAAAALGRLFRKVIVLAGK